MGTLNTLGRGGAKATAPGMEKGGSWGQARGGGLESGRDWGGGCAPGAGGVQRGRRHEAGTGEEGVGRGDGQATGR